MCVHDENISLINVVIHLSHLRDTSYELYVDKGTTSLTFPVPDVTETDTCSVTSLCISSCCCI